MLFKVPLTLLKCTIGLHSWLPFKVEPAPGGRILTQVCSKCRKNRYVYYPAEFDNKIEKK